MPSQRGVTRAPGIASARAALAAFTLSNSRTRLANAIDLLRGILVGWYSVAARRFALADRDVFGGAARQFGVVTLLLSLLLPGRLRAAISGAV